MNGPFYVVIREGTGDGEMPSYLLGIFTCPNRAEDVRYHYDRGPYNAVLLEAQAIDEVVSFADGGI